MGRISFYLPQHLLEDVLERTPVKPLLRFKCVSKLWRFIISSKRFTNAHLKTSTKRANYTDQAVISTYLNKAIRETEFPVFSNSEDRSAYTNLNDNVIEVVGYSNGLSCLLQNGEDFLLWNPCTRKCNKLPSVNSNSPYSILGFGYDEFNVDYKILAVLSDYNYDVDRFDYTVKIYSLRMNSWKRIEDIKNCYSPEGRAKFVSGKLHWASVDRVSSIWTIVSFDLHTEVFGIMEQPSYDTDEYHYVSVEVVEERLALLRYCEEKDWMDIWILKEYKVKESWYKTVRIFYGQVFRSCPWTSPLCVTGKLEIFYKDRSGFGFYNPKSNSYRHYIGNYSTDTGEVSIQSLVSPFDV